jgi:hypothetical protein
MPNVKTISLLLLVQLSLGCSVISEDPWGWLEEPSEQIWKDIEINAISRNVVFAVPDRPRNSGSRTEYWSDVNASEDVSNINLSIEDERRAVAVLSRVDWDAWWGGFYKKGGEDFYLSVNVFFREDAPNFLDLSLDQRIDWTYSYWKSKFLKPQSGRNPNKEYFLEHFWLKTFEAESGLHFVRHNAPTGSESYQHFTIPLSDQHILDFAFFVNDLRYGQKEDPKWNQSRWEMVEKIMNTVRITPDPFGDQPEAIPAR